MLLEYKYMENSHNRVKGFESIVCDELDYFLDI